MRTGRKVGLIGTFARPLLGSPPTAPLPPDPACMDILVMIAQLTLSLSILVVLHELGHFLPAKWFGCRVEKFYLFFDPYFSLFKKKIGETEWGVGWLPLGGYVKISGMIDESMDMEQMEGPAQPWEFRSKPAWQRLIIMLGGVSVNFVLGFAIYAGMLMYWGTNTLAVDPATTGILAEPFGEQYGLRDGDRVVGVGKRDLETFGEREVKSAILFEGARELRIVRDGAPLTLTLPDSLQRNLGKEQYRNCSFFSLPLEPLVGYVEEGSPADSMGLALGDEIVAVDGAPVVYQQDVIERVRAREPGDAVTFTVERDGRTLDLAAVLPASRTIGFAVQIDEQYDYVAEDYTLAEAIPAGISSGLDKLAMQGRAVGQMFKSNIDASDSVGSFITIGRTFGGTWDWQKFWSLTALLSLILAVMNLLPIPALDGGHVMFLLYEVVTGRKPGDKFLQTATTIGFGLVLLLMGFAIFNDIRKAVFGAADAIC